MTGREMEIRRIHWVEAFPFLRLFQSFRMARSPSRIFLALCAVLAIYAVGRVLDAIWLGMDRGIAVPVTMTAQTDTIRDALATGDPSLAMRAAMRDAMIGDRDVGDYRMPEQDEPARIGPFAALMKLKIRSVERVISGAWAAISLRGGVSQFVDAAAIGGYGALFVAKTRPVFYALFLLLSMGVLSFFCGAIARSAAIDATVDEGITTREAVTFAKARWTDFLAAPVFAGLLMLVFLVPLWLFGLVGAIPALGDLITGLFLPIGLLLAFVVAMILIGTLLGFHLMWPTIAVENSDKLDAVSRSYSFVDQRPWHLAFYAVVWLVYAGICLGFVRWLFFLALKVLHASLSWVMGGVGATADGVAKLEQYWRMPDLAQLTSIGGAGVPFYGDFPAGDFGFVGDTTAFLIRFWVYLAVAIFAALALSFWVCGSVQMYLLMRRGVDGTDYADIHYERALRGAVAMSDEAEPATADAESAS